MQQQDGGACGVVHLHLQRANETLLPLITLTVLAAHLICL